MLPGLLNTYALTTDEPSAEVLADYMARLAQLHAAPPINVQSSVEESESLAARLAAARLTHLAPQFAPSEATAWMAFTNFVAWNMLRMLHPQRTRGARLHRVSRARVTRAVAAAGRSDPDLTADDIFGTLQRMYGAELRVALLYDAERPLFFSEIGWIRWRAGRPAAARRRGQRVRCVRGHGCLLLRRGAAGGLS